MNKRLSAKQAQSRREKGAELAFETLVLISSVKTHLELTEPWMIQQIPLASCFWRPKTFLFSLYRLAASCIARCGET